MPYAFDHLELIQDAFAHQPRGLISDIDGTISDITLIPDQAMVSAVCHEQLARLRRQLDLVAIVSGRPAVRARSMVGLDGIVYVGNHGLERMTEDRPEIPPSLRHYTAEFQKLEAELGAKISDEEIRFENKGLALALHYRGHRNPQSAEDRIMDALDSSQRVAALRVSKSRMAVEVLPPVDINKGTASLDLIREYGLRSVIYIGDDRTDIDAFCAIHQAAAKGNFRGLAIGVTSGEMPPGLTEEADYTLNGVKDVGRFLCWLREITAKSG